MKTTKLGRKDRAKISALVLGELSPEESLDLLGKIEGDPEASQELEMEIDILNFMSEEGASLPVPQDKRVGILSQLCASTSARWLWMPRKWRIVLVVSTVVALLLVAGEVTKTFRSGSQYSDLVAIDGLDFQVTLRASLPVDFDLASRLYQEGKVDDAIKVLSRYVRAHPTAEHLDQAEYVLGLMCLRSARNVRLFVFSRYDLEKVRTGIEYLDTAIRDATNLRLLEESHWAKGMALLMIEERNGAIHEFEAVASGGGIRSTQASAVLTKLQERNRNR